MKGYFGLRAIGLDLNGWDLIWREREREGTSRNSASGRVSDGGAIADSLEQAVWKLQLMVAAVLGRSVAAACVGKKTRNRWDREEAEAAIYGGQVLGR